MHSLTAEGRENVVRFAREALRADGRLYLEFRTGEDLHETRLFGDDHFREFLDPEQVAASIRELGGEVVHLEQGHGLAPYKSEDPHVARLVVTWGHER